MARWLYPRFAVQPPQTPSTLSGETGFQPNAFQGDAFQEEAAPEVAKWLRPWEQSLPRIFPRAVFEAASAVPIVLAAAPPLLYPLGDDTPDLLFLPRSPQNLGGICGPPVFSGPETTSVDKWFPIDPDSVNRPPYPCALYETARAFSPNPYFGPEVTTLDKWIGDQPDSMPRPYSRGTYEAASSAPLFVAEKVFVDKWQMRWPDPLSRLYSRAEFEGGAFYAPFVTAPVEQIFVDKWGGQQPALIHRRPPPPEGTYIRPSFFAPETTSVDRWTGYQPSYLRRVPFQEGIYVRPSFFAPEITSVDKWTGSQPIWLPAPRGQFPGLFALNNALFLEQVLADKWLGSQPPWLKQPKQGLEGLYIRPAFFGPELTSVDRWVGTQPAWLQRPRFAFDGLLANTFQVNELVFPDKWLGYQPARLQQPRFSFDGTYTRPSFFAPEITSVDRWTGSQPAWLSRPKFSFDGLFTNTFQVNELVLADKWLGSQPSRLQQPRYSFDGMYVRPAFFAPEITSLDRWFQPFSTPLRQMQGPASTSIAPLEQTQLSQWFSPWQNPPSRRPSLRLDLLGTIYAPEQIFVDKWLGYQPHWIQPRRYVQEGLYARPSFFGPESTSLDKWIGYQPSWLPPRVYTREGLYVRPTFFAPEITSVDKWSPIRPDLRYPTAYPLATFLPSPSAPGLGYVSPQHWTPPTIVPGRAFAQELPPFLFESSVIEQPLLTKWFQPWSIPVRLPAQPIHLPFGFLSPAGFFGIPLLRNLPSRSMFLDVRVQEPAPPAQDPYYEPNREGENLDTSKDSTDPYY